MAPRSGPNVGRAASTAPQPKQSGAAAGKAESISSAKMRPKAQTHAVTPHQLPDTAVARASQAYSSVSYRCPLRQFQFFERFCLTAYLQGKGKTGGYQPKG